MHVAAWPLSLISSSPGCRSTRRFAWYSFSTCCVTSTPFSSAPQLVDESFPINCWEPLPWTGCAMAPTGWSWMGKSYRSPRPLPPAAARRVCENSAINEIQSQWPPFKVQYWKLEAPGYVWIKRELLAGARTRGQPMDNIHVAHRLTTLIHPLTTLRRAGPSAN